MAVPTNTLIHGCSDAFIDRVGNARVIRSVTGITFPSVTYYGLIISLPLGTLCRHTITRTPLLLLQRRF